MVPQQDNLDEELTVRDNLYIYGRYFGMKRREIVPRIKDLLAFAQLEDKAANRVDQLSGGMKRRLTIARSLINDPAVLLLDEPTTGLDPESRRLAWNLLRKANENGTTIVITTHYLEEAEQLCDRLAIMHRGRIATSGTLSDVVAGHHSTIRVGARPDLPRFEDMSTHDGVTEIRTMNLQHDLTELLVWARNNNVPLTLSLIHISEPTRPAA